MNCEGWTKVKIGALASIKGGKRLPKGVNLQTIPNSHPYIRVRDLNGTKYVCANNDFEYVDDNTQQGISRYIVNSNDIIISIVGSIGLVAKVHWSLDGANLTENCAKFVDLNGLDNDYLYYFLISGFGQSEIKTGTVGAVQPKLPLKNIQDISIPLPPLPEQRIIAQILSSLDDKIELNNRMNKTLEEIAQAIFKRWFVDFEFPDENGNPYKSSDGMMTESELGLIPLGWKVEKFSNVVFINPKRTIKRGQISKFLEMKNASNFYSRVAEFSIKKFDSSGAKFSNGDVLLARITPCLENGKGAYVDFLDNGEIGWGSTEFIIFAERILKKTFIYWYTRTVDFRKFSISNMSGTSGRQRVNADSYNQLSVVVPDNKLQSRFEITALSIFKILKSKDDESLIMTQLRDTLLPKLMSGEIRVPTSEAK